MIADFADALPQLLRLIYPLCESVAKGTCIRTVSFLCTAFETNCSTVLFVGVVLYCIKLYHLISTPRLLCWGFGFAKAFVAQAQALVLAIHVTLLKPAKRHVEECSRRSSSPHCTHSCSVAVLLQCPRFRVQQNSAVEHEK